MIKFAIFTLLVLIGASGTRAQMTPSNEGRLADSTAVKTRLLELFQLSQQKQYAKAASLLVYRGKDSTRKWIDCYNYSNPHEQKEIERVCDHLAKFAERKFRYELYLKDTEHSDAWYVWNLGYEDHDNHISVAFAFKKIRGEFCLADVD